MKTVIKVVLIGMITFLLTGCKSEEEKRQEEMQELKKEIEDKKKEYYKLEEKTRGKGGVQPLSVLMKKSIEDAKKSDWGTLKNTSNIKDKQ